MLTNSWTSYDLSQKKEVQGRMKLFLVIQFADNYTE